MNLFFRKKVLIVRSVGFEENLAAILAVEIQKKYVLKLLDPSASFNNPVTMWSLDTAIAYAGQLAGIVIPNKSAHDQRLAPLFQAALNKKFVVFGSRAKFGAVEFPNTILIPDKSTEWESFASMLTDQLD